MKTNGFSLLELLTALVILVILLGIAVPVYQAYVTRANRTEGKNALMALLHAQENRRGVCPAYAPALGTATDCQAGQVAATATTENGYYLLAITAASDTGFTAVATAAGAQKTRDTDCPQLELAVTGGNLATTPEACWK